MSSSSSFDEYLDADGNRHDEASNEMVEDQYFGEKDVREDNSEDFAAGGRHNAYNGTKLLDDSGNEGKGEEGQCAAQSQRDVYSWYLGTIFDGFEKVSGQNDVHKAVSEAKKVHKLNDLPSGNSFVFHHLLLIVSYKRVH